ncbi:PLDc N-terminal domain-containing protein [Paenibacillus allorhizosphaerae]|uniref:Cardiolipin synthase N-terminal domain-containing protein n=1 Tax=Paenibacillus allorhizosphaerae TaxID=2849866 RepID=A0ABN7TBP5_9BACL|nr:PLDc N-terminal domain-containing protein [Paenibacillus allorhizosphaerae]CAG7619066.1 hypothetical protein PAECIP111802_00582 [Paenibacillus allorhizosphaerae]
MVSIIGVGLLFMLILFALNIITSVWAYNDCLSKGRSREFALLVLILTLIFPVMGLIVYLIIRNQ